MVIRSVLENWINGNFSDLTRNDLLSLVKYFEVAADNDYITAEELIEEEVF